MGFSARAPKWSMAAVHVQQTNWMATREHLWQAKQFWAKLYRNLLREDKKRAKRAWQSVSNCCQPAESQNGRAGLKVGGTRKKRKGQPAATDRESPGRGPDLFCSFLRRKRTADQLVLPADGRRSVRSNSLAFGFWLSQILPAGD